MSFPIYQGVASFEAQVQLLVQIRVDLKVGAINAASGKEIKRSELNDSVLARGLRCDAEAAKEHVKIEYSSNDVTTLKVYQKTEMGVGIRAVKEEFEFTYAQAALSKNQCRELFF